MKPGALIVVAMVDPETAPATFRRKRLEWPLHVTLLPWFTVADETKLIDFLQTNLPSESGFDAVVGENAAFGENGETMVSLISNREPFALLHNYLFEVITGQDGVILANTWIRESYKPHVTHHGDNRLYPGDVFSVQGLTLVRLLDEDMCEVIMTIPLGSGA